MTGYQSATQPVTTALDPRIRRTRKWLAEALIALSAEQGYDTVTIKAIAERANVAYATFFRHYRNKDELMLHILEAEMESLWSITTPDMPADRMTAKQRYAYFIATSRAFFERIDGNSTVYYVLLTSPGTHNVLRHLQEQLAGHILSLERHLLDYITGGRIPAEVLAHHVASSIFTLIAWWLEQGKPYPPGRMAEIYTALIVDPWNTPRWYAREVSDNNTSYPTAPL